MTAFRNVEVPQHFGNIRIFKAHPWAGRLLVRTLMPPTNRGSLTKTGRREFKFSFESGQFFTFRARNANEAVALLITRLRLNGWDQVK